jgi:hypothetical protein
MSYLQFFNLREKALKDLYGLSCSLREHSLKFIISVMGVNPLLVKNDLFHCSGISKNIFPGTCVT